MATNNVINNATDINNRYFIAPGFYEGITLSGVFSAVADTVYCHPFYLQSKITVIRIAFNLQTAAAGKFAALGIYNNDGTKAVDVVEREIRDIVAGRLACAARR